MNSTQRLTAALTICLREVDSKTLKLTCVDVIDKLTVTLLKEQGGTKVSLSGSARGRSIPKIIKKQPKQPSQ